MDKSGSTILKSTVEKVVVSRPKAYTQSISSFGKENEARVAEFIEMNEQRRCRSLIQPELARRKV